VSLVSLICAICILQIMESSRTRIGWTPGAASAAAAVALSLLLPAGPAAAASLLPDVGWTSACGASSCFDTKGAYRLTFSASQFSGPMDISRLLLDGNVLFNSASDFFTVSFSLGGNQLGSWGQWNMSGVGGDEMSLWGSDFTWNPADGDLVLVLQLVTANGQAIGLDQGGGSGGGGFFFWNGSALEGRGSGSDPAGDTGGSVLTLVPPPSGDLPIIEPPTPDGGQTTPTGGQPAPAPEPAAWAMMIAGFGLAGAALRRRNLLAANA
jgi:hypothetical protein